MEGKLDFEAGETEEVAIVGAQRGAMFDGEGGQVGVHDEGTPRARARKEITEDSPVALMRIDNHYTIQIEPASYDASSLI